MLQWWAQRILRSSDTPPKEKGELEKRIGTAQRLTNTTDAQASAFSIDIYQGLRGKEVSTM
jgi:hypothetical protein